MQVRVASEIRDRIEAIYRDQGDRIWRAVWAYSHDTEVASDAVAEAFAQALARGDAITSPAAWIWRAVFRIAAGMLQERRRMAELGRTLPYHPSDATSGLLWALQQLPTRQRATLILFYYADHSVREVAAILGSSVVAVRVNLTRGRKRLRRILEAHHG